MSELTTSTTASRALARTRVHPVVWLLGAGLAVRLALAAWLPVLEAESYYWTWSRQLDWGFHDHPPLVALLIKTGTTLFGDGPLGLRAGHLALGTLAGLVFWRFCRRQVGPRAALASVGLLSVAPFWMPFGAVATPDGPLLAFWLFSLATFSYALRGERTGPWLLTGLLTGLTMLSKYNGAQLPALFALCLVCSSSGRAWLRRPGPWLGLALSVVVILPNLLWNLEHGASAASMPFKSGLEPEHAPQHLLRLAALPFVLMTPLLAWAWVRESLAWWRSPTRWSDEERLLLVLGSWAPMLAFGLVALVTEVHAQWIVTTFVCALPLALRNLDGCRDGAPSPASLRRAMAGAVGLVLLVAALAASVPLLARSGWSPARRGAFELSGWDELRGRLRAETRDRHPAPRLASMNFHLVSRMQWLMQGELEGLPLNPDHRHQYRLWLGSELLGSDALFVAKFDPETTADMRAQRLRSWFERVELLAPIEVELSGATVRRFELLWCEGLKRLD